MSLEDFLVFQLYNLTKLNNISYHVNCKKQFKIVCSDIYDSYKKLLSYDGLHQHV